MDDLVKKERSARIRDYPALAQLGRGTQLFLKVVCINLLDYICFRIRDANVVVKQQRGQFRTVKDGEALFRRDRSSDSISDLGLDLTRPGLS
jgi:hypothetical protein